MRERRGKAVQAMPASALTVYEGPVSRRALDLLWRPLRHVGDDGELVERPLVLPRGHLHDGREEGLRVEEA